MKKILLILLALSCVFCVMACTKTGNRGDQSEITETESETTPKKEPISKPNGYDLYTNGDLTFAYPKSWQKTDGSIVYLIDPSGNGNNITVVHEAKTNMYDNLTSAAFKEKMEPYFTAMGGSMKNVKVKYETNDHGLSLMVASFDTTLSGKSMKQTQYVTTIGNKTYTVTVTEVESAPAVTQTIFDTLRKN